MPTLAQNTGQFIIDASLKQGRPLNDNEGKTLIGLMLNPERANAPELEDELMKVSPIFAILTSRIKHHAAANVSLAARVFLSELAGGSPGNAVLYVAVCAAIAKGSDKVIELVDIVDAFPMAVPTTEILHEAWDDQKGGEHGGQRYDNGLDMSWAWLEEVA